MAIEDDIRKRLAELVEQHSQTVIAKAGGVPSSSVHRYLRGRRIPVEFCANLCRALEINVMWLLYGAGSSVETEGVEQAGALADELGGLVASLVSIEREIGAVLPSDIAAGKFHRLHALLQQTATTRAKVQTAIEPVATRMLEAMYEALNKGHRIKTADLDRSLRYLLQLDLPEALRSNIELAISAFAYHERDYEESVQLRQAAMWRHLASPHRDFDTLLQLAMPVVSALNVVEEYQDALALSDALLAGISVFLGDDDRLLQLRISRTWTLYETGNVREALAEVSTIFPRLKTKEARDNAYVVHQQVEVLTGIVDIHDAIRIGEDRWERTRVLGLIRFALWSEDKSILKIILEKHRQIVGKIDKHRATIGLYAECMLDALNGKTNKALSVWQEAIDGTPTRYRWVALNMVREAALHRITGSTKKARSILKKAVQGIEDGTFAPIRPVIRQGFFAREAHRLGIKSPFGFLGGTVEEWRDRVVADGCNLFRDW